MTRYEIALGIVPPPEPPVEYVMGVDLGMQGETVCALCHRDEPNGRIWVDRLDFIPPGKDSLCMHLANFSLKAVADDDHTPGKKLGDARHALLTEGDRVSLSPEVGNEWLGLQDRIRSRRWAEKFSEDLTRHTRSWVGTPADDAYSDEIDALARAVWLIKEQERPMPTLKSSGGRKFTI